MLPNACVPWKTILSYDVPDYSSFARRTYILVEFLSSAPLIYNNNSQHPDIGKDVFF